MGTVERVPIVTEVEPGLGLGFGLDGGPVVTGVEPDLGLGFGLDRGAIVTGVEPDLGLGFELEGGTIVTGVEPGLVLGFVDTVGPIGVLGGTGVEGSVDEGVLTLLTVGAVITGNFAGVSLRVMFPFGKTLKKPVIMYFPGFKTLPCPFTGKKAAIDI